MSGEQCPACDAVRREVASLRAQFAAHEAWAGRAERLVALEKRLEDHARHQLELRNLDDQARTLAFNRLNERLESMNELRAQISGERGRYVERTEIENKLLAHQAMVTANYEQNVRRIGALENWRSAQDATRMTLQRVAAIVGAVAGGLAGFLAQTLHR